MANSVDPDEMPPSATVSHLGLYCLLRPVCPNTYGEYDSSARPDISFKQEMLKCVFYFPTEKCIVDSHLN